MLGHPPVIKMLNSSSPERGFLLILTVVRGFTVCKTNSNVFKWFETMYTSFNSFNTAKNDPLRGCTIINIKVKFESSFSLKNVQ